MGGSGSGSGVASECAVAVAALTAAHECGLAWGLAAGSCAFCLVPSPPPCCCSQLPDLRSHPPAPHTRDTHRGQAVRGGGAASQAAGPGPAARLPS